MSCGEEIVRKPKAELTVAERAVRYPTRLKGNTRKKVQTAEAILYFKDEEPIVISKHPTKKNKYLAEGL